MTVDFLWNFLQSILKLIRGLLAFLILVFIVVMCFALYESFKSMDAARKSVGSLPGVATPAYAEGLTANPISGASDMTPLRVDLPRPGASQARQRVSTPFALAQAAQSSPTPPAPFPSAPTASPQAPSASAPPQKAAPTASAQAADQTSPIVVTVTHIGRSHEQFMPENFAAVSMQLKNNGTKAIKATKGSLVVFNVFGDPIARFTVENAKTIRPGKYVVEAGNWNVMFDPKAQNAITGSDADPSKLTFSFDPKLILFEDGTRLQF